MNKCLNNLKLLACVISGFILAWNIKCSSKCPDTETIKERDTSYIIYKDTGTHTIKNIESNQINYMSKAVPLIVDTIAILKKYYSTTVYIRKFKNDSLEATAIDSISQNKIIGTSGLKYKWLIPYKTMEIINQPHIILKNKVFIGLQLKGSINSFAVIPSIILITKSDKTFSGGFDILNKEFLIGTYFKLHF